MRLETGRQLWSRRRLLLADQLGLPLKGLLQVRLVGAILLLRQLLRQVWQLMAQREIRRRPCCAGARLATSILN